MNKKSTLSKAESNYLTHTKKEKGITLIALVVTIVVLITLATVSINTVLGQNGIISKAKQAKEIYSNTIVQEDEEMKVLLNEMVKIKEKNSWKEIQSDTLLKNYIYNGKEQKWVPTVTDENGTKLIKDKDYTVEYSRTNFIDAGDIIVSIKGCGNYTGTIIKKYTIEKANLTVTTPSGKKVYNGKEQKWVPTVTDENGTKLIKDKDYTVEYSSTNFIDAGDIIVSIKGCGNYTGTIIKKYTIEKADLIITTPSVTKEYNGYPISLEGYEATVEGLVNGETISITLTGSQTDVGSSASSYTINGNESTAKLTNYNIINKIGTLTVERRHTPITP